MRIFGACLALLLLSASTAIAEPRTNDKIAVAAPAAPDNHTGFVLIGTSTLAPNGPMWQTSHVAPMPHECTVSKGQSIELTTTEGMRLRSEPSPRSEVIARIPSGATVYLIGAIDHYGTCWGKIDVKAGTVLHATRAARLPVEVRLSVTRPYSITVLSSSARLARLSAFLTA